ncbi:hypothetical protein RN001_014618 [Aquatica leii]|uniref:SKA complex subunit 1 n=1 Tax=Aquatica leii TaxID=1421715 RepID=A0AAN7NY91_9COLE|nr:hypothetical protein RN001_014618 [Aquatica leii]
MQSLCDKIDLLNLNMSFIEYGKVSKADCINIITKTKTNTDCVVKKLELAKQLLEKHKTLFRKLLEIEKEVQKRINDLNGINLSSENIGNHVLLDHSDVDMSNGTCSTNCYNISPSPLIPRRNITTVTPNYLTFDISPLTIDEYKLIPKYMLGRLTLESINSFIDHVNSTLLSKYNLLSKPVKSLKNTELQLRKQFQMQQSGQLKVKRFVTETDIAREYNKPVLGKKTCNLLTILRHSDEKRESNVTGGGTIPKPSYGSFVDVLIEITDTKTISRLINPCDGDAAASAFYEDSYKDEVEAPSNVLLEITNPKTLTGLINLCNGDAAASAFYDYSYEDEVEASSSKMSRTVDIAHSSSLPSTNRDPDVITPLSEKLSVN